MDRRTFLSMMLHGSLVPLFAPGLASQILIRQCIAMPIDTLMDISAPRITVVGVGRFGADNARLLARNEPQIDCHAIVFGQTSPDPGDFDGLFRSIQSGELLFIITGYDDCYCAPVVRACAETAQAVGIPVVNIVPQRPDSFAPATPAGTTFSVSDSVAARHLVTTITHLVASPSFVGIDSADVKAIVQSGNKGLLGIGSAAGKDRGHRAGQLTVIYSQWQGYLEPVEGESRHLADMRAIKENKFPGIIFNYAHTSGHAPLDDLQRLVQAIKPAKLVPIHTQFPDRYEELFGIGTVATDGISIDVRAVLS